MPITLAAFEDTLMASASEGGGEIMPMSRSTDGALDRFFGVAEDRIDLDRDGGAGLKNEKLEPRDGRFLDDVFCSATDPDDFEDFSTSGSLSLEEDVLADLERVNPGAADFSFAGVAESSFVLRLAGVAAVVPQSPRMPPPAVR
jgi:hypothetical protein